MAMSWQTLVLLSVVFMSIGSLLQRIIMKDDKSDPWLYSIIFQLMVGVLIAIFGFIFSDMTFPKDYSGLVLNLVLMVLLWSVSNYFLYTALKTMEASTFNIIFSTRSLFTALASSLFLNEILSGKQFLGVLLILFGVAIVLINKKTFKKFDKAVIFSVFAAACFGFANTNDRVLLSSFNLYPYVTLAFVTPAVFMAMLKPQTFKNINRFLDKSLVSKMILLCFFYTAASATFFSALQVSPNSSQVAAISVSSVILTVILSIVLLKERDNLARKLIGAVVSFLGLFLVS